MKIGGLSIRLRTEDSPFRQILEQRYSGFIAPDSIPEFEFLVDLRQPALSADPEADVQVRGKNGRWELKRGDFVAEWDTQRARGHIVQSRNPYSVDSVLRIVHSLVLAREGGFLLHAASAVRSGCAFLFAGVSGAGKTTISRLAPPDATLLTDEVSYIRRDGEGYRACGTPFTGELAQLGRNVSAPIATLFLLKKGNRNCVEPIDPADAVHAVLRNILFFAEDDDLVKLLFQSACDFVSAVPVRRLTFVPDQRVWEMVG